ncbi:hypothetical protein EYC80_003032 [Monilinia laxa]|uniref:Uncharacterized protein n=1 Tax=Monilinia laxa TaxID=61186 RepID=A0A5N6KCG2_MONLA|nr:hypothetical protein EYC80_003032 [Monilinia laxa]
MSRVTPPVTKFTQIIRRSISTTSTVASPSAQLKTKGAKADLISKLSHERTITTTHRPLPPSIKTMPLMQGFRTSAPRPSPSASISTLDHLVLPRLPSASQAFTVRVPILPDNYSASQSIKESIDTAIPKQEIHIVSAQPEEAFAAVNVLTEVVGNEGEASMDLGEWVEGMRARGEEIRGKLVGRDSEQGVLAELWTSIQEDVFGSKGKDGLARFGRLELEFHTLMILRFHFLLFRLAVRGVCFYFLASLVWLAWLYGGGLYLLLLHLLVVPCEIFDSHFNTSYLVRTDLISNIILS